MRRKKRGAKSLVLAVTAGAVLGAIAGYGNVQQVKAHEAAVVESLKAAPEINYDRLREQSVMPASAICIDADISEEIRVSAIEVGTKYSISPELLEAMAWYESTNDPTAVNGSCAGLMQISSKWHSDRMKRLGVSDADLFLVYPNMLVAGDYLAELFETYGDVTTVLAVYHGEAGATSASYAPSSYVRKVITLAIELTERGGES